MEKIIYRVLTPKRLEEIETERQKRRRHPIRTEERPDGRTVVQEHTRLIVRRLDDDMRFDTLLTKTAVACGIIDRNPTLRNKARTRRTALNVIHLLMDTLGLTITDIREHKK